MRSKSPDNKLASNADSSIERVALRARLPLALTALAAILSLGTSADAAGFGGRGFGGFGGGGLTGFGGGRLTTPPISIISPVGKIGKRNPSIGGGHIEGGRTGGGGDHHPR